MLKKYSSRLLHRFGCQLKPEVSQMCCIMLVRVVSAAPRIVNVQGEFASV